MKANTDAKEIRNFLLFILSIKKVNNAVKQELEMLFRWSFFVKTLLKVVLKDFYNVSNRNGENFHNIIFNCV